MITLVGKWGRRGRPPKSEYEKQGTNADAVIRQKNYIGAEEALRAAEYPIELRCESCGASRWIRIQDKHQVKFCKPCTRNFRLGRRRERAAVEAIEKKVEAAEESLSDWNPEDV